MANAERTFDITLKTKLDPKGFDDARRESEKTRKKMDDDSRKSKQPAPKSSPAPAEPAPVRPTAPAPKPRTKKPATQTEPAAPVTPTPANEPKAKKPRGRSALASEAMAGTRMEAPTGPETQQEKLDRLNREIKQLWGAKPRAAGLVTGPNGYATFQKSTGEMLADRLKERTALKREMQLIPPPLPKIDPEEEKKKKARMTPPPLPKTLKEAKQAAPAMSEALKQGVSAASGLLSVGGFGTAGEKVSRGATVAKTAIAALGTTTAATVGIIAGGVAVVGLLAKALANGAGDAAKMVKELDQLTSEDRNAKLKSLGDIGDVLKRSSSSLLEYSRNAERAGRKGADFFQAGGTEIVPLLNEMAKAVDSIDFANMGAGLGSLARELIEVATPLDDFIKLYNQLPKNTQKTLQRAVFGGPMMLADIGNAMRDPKAEQEADRVRRKRDGAAAIKSLSDSADQSDRFRITDYDTRNRTGLKWVSDVKNFEILSRELATNTNSDGSRMTAGDVDRAKKQALGFREGIYSGFASIEDASRATSRDTLSNEARVKGDASTVRALEYIKNLGDLRNAGIPLEQAERAAQAADAANNYEPANVSGLAARGGSVGESLASSANEKNFLDLKRVGELQTKVVEESRDALRDVVRLLEEGLKLDLTYGRAAQ